MCFSTTSTRRGMAEVKGEAATMAAADGWRKFGSWPVNLGFPLGHVQRPQEIKDFIAGFVKGNQFIMGFHKP